jgi:hypothetical protein
MTTASKHAPLRENWHGLRHITVVRILPTNNGMPSFDLERIIAVDLRPQSLGYVVLEAGDSLIDWGVKDFPGGAYSVRIPLRAKVNDLLAACVPDAIVLRRRAGTDAMLPELEQAAKARGVEVSFLTRRTVKSYFPGCRNKDQIASAISERFLDLRLLLPPKRKIWKKEYKRMRIFDAAATGIAYFGEKQKQTAAPFPPS